MTIRRGRVPAQERFLAWAPRLHEHRIEAQERFRLNHSCPPLGAQRRVELLGLFGLDLDAAWDEVQEAYERLSQVHDPHRYTPAPAIIQHRHAELLAVLNEAYERLERAYERDAS